jgi:cell division protein FtsW
MTAIAYAPARDSRKLDLAIVALTAALVGVGIVAVFSASFAKEAAAFGDTMFYAKRQAAAAAIGAVGMVFAARFNLRKLRRIAYPAVLIAFVALLLVLVFGVEINGARRWFQIGFFHFQPSEFAKLVAIIAVAKYAVEKPRELQTLRGAAWPMIGAGALVLPVIVEDLGSAVVIMALAFLVAVLGGARWRELRVFAAPGAVLIAIFILIAPYRLQRIIDHFHPDPNKALGSRYQVRHSVIALGAGGLVGRGLGQSSEKYCYLPAAETDCIFAIIGEEGGLIGTWGLLALFALLGWRGLVAAQRAAHPFHSLIAAGVTSMIMMQVIINIAVVTGLAPTKGAPLPFVSYGGSSLLVNMIGIGLLLNVTRQRKLDSFAGRPHGAGEQATEVAPA